MAPTYLLLIRELCKLCGLAPGNADTIAEGAVFDVEGVGFHINHDESSTPERLLIFCEYGPVDPASQAEAYRALLENNLFFYPQDLAVFSIVPPTGIVVCCVRFQLAPLRAAELRDVLATQAMHAREWRGNRSLAPTTDGGAAVQRSNANSLLLRERVAGDGANSAV